MDATFPTQTYTIDGRTFVEAAGKLVEIVGSTTAAIAAAPEVAAALAAGSSVAAVVAVGTASLPVKQLSREDAMQLGAEERARFGGDLAAMHAAGYLQSPFQNQALIDSLPTQAQLEAVVPHPAAMAAPNITFAPTAPTDNITTYPQYVAPPVSIPDPGNPGMTGPLTSPIAAPGSAPFVTPDVTRMPGFELPDTTELESRQKNRDYTPASSTTEGLRVLGRFNDCYPKGEGQQDLTGTSSKAFADLKKSLSDSIRPGDEVDHIVTQAQTDKFGTEVIQHEANVIVHPNSTHTARTAIGNRLTQEGSIAAENGFRLVRDATSVESFGEQYRIGLQEIRQAMDARNVSPEEREYIEAQIRDRESKMPEICKPGQTMLDKTAPTLDDMLQNAIDGHNETSARQLPDVRSVAQWDGTTRSGTFVDIGNGLVAQHQGQGSYAVADVARDLNGVQPPIGQYATLQQNGQVQVPQQTQSLGLGVG